MPDMSFEIINCIFSTSVGLIGSTCGARARAKDLNRQSIDAFLRDEWGVYLPGNLEVGKSHKSRSESRVRITEVYYNGKGYNLISERVFDHWLTNRFESTRLYQAIELQDV
jgi:hypothetical protein